MRIGLIAVGRMKQGPERELVARYLDRATAAGKTLGLTGFAVTELTESRAGSSQSRKTEEAKAIAAALPLEGEPSEAALRSALRDAELLLVVDNIEHVLDAAAPLIGETIGENLDGTIARFGDREALVSVHQDVRLT